jgi:hypothetical protein
MLFFLYWRRRLRPQHTLWTNSIERNWSWKTNICSTNKKVAKFHRTGNFVLCPQEAVTGSYNEPHATWSHTETYLFKIPINIIIPPTPRLTFPRKKFACIFSLNHTYYMPRPSYPSWFGHPKKYWIMSTGHNTYNYAEYHIYFPSCSKLLRVQPSPRPCVTFCL